MKNNIKIFKPNKDNYLNNLFIEEGISAGFPSPAGDFEESRISLEKVVVKNKEATFYAKVSGESMKDAGLNDGDILVIDRSEELKNNKIAVCYLNGEFTVKRIKKENMKSILLALLLGLSLVFLTNCSSNKIINCEEFDINYNRIGCFRI